MRCMIIPCKPIFLTHHTLAQSHLIFILRTFIPHMDCDKPNTRERASERKRRENGENGKIFPFSCVFSTLSLLINPHNEQPKLFNMHSLCNSGIFKYEWHFCFLLQLDISLSCRFKFIFVHVELQRKKMMECEIQRLK
jgi:hypothetical protein